MNRRHHHSHPPTSVKPNAAVNQKTESYTPKAPVFAPSPNSALPGAVHQASPEEAADYNPSTQPRPETPVDSANQRLGKIDSSVIS
jgi:hypothetical protein